MAQQRKRKTVNKTLWTAGIKEGQMQFRVKALTLVQKKVMDPDIKRGSEEYNFLLKFAEELSLELKVDDGQQG